MNFLFTTYRGLQLCNVLGILLNAGFVWLQFSLKSGDWWAVFAALNATCVLMGVHGLYRLHCLKRDGLL